MRITDFIDSPDVAEHFETAFRRENYPDYALRCAWIILNSQRRSAKEKHRAW